MTKMKSLMISLLLIAFMVVAALAVFPQAKAESEVIILSHTIFQTYGGSPFSVNQGDFWVAGEVQNNGAQATHFDIIADFYDQNSALSASTSLSDPFVDAPPSYLHVLQPGQKSPFMIYLPRFDDSGNYRTVDHYELRITSSQAAEFRSGFQITSSNSHETAGELYVEGEVKNVGTHNIDGFNVFATFYNASGDVVSVVSEGGTFSRAAPGEGFAPNQTTTFSIKLDDFPEGGKLQRVDSYELTVEGYNYSLWTAD
jgi:hypothetical protein